MADAFASRFTWNFSQLKQQNNCFVFPMSEETKRERVYVIGGKLTLFRQYNNQKMATVTREYTMEIDNDNMVARTFFPGITYDDFDRSGGIAPWKMCRMIEAGRAVPFFQGNFLDFNDLTSENSRFYVLGGDYYFDSCLWETTRQYKYFPYEIKMDVIDIGQSSLTLREIFINSLDGKEIASYYVKLVYVNTRTKRSQELPYWHRKKYRKMESAEKVRVDSYDYNVPNHASKLKTVVVASDTDYNGHTNQASYIRFCMDAAASAVRQDAFKRLTQDICLYPVLKMSASYRKETLVGDEILTSVWQDDLSPETLYFTVHTGDKLSFTSTMKFKSTQFAKL